MLNIKENTFKRYLLCLIAVVLAIMVISWHYVTKEDRILILNQHLKFVEKIQVDDSFMMNKARVTSFSKEPVKFKYNFISNDDGTYKMETYLHIYNLIDDVFNSYDKFIVKDSKGNHVKTFNFFDIKLNTRKGEGRHESSNYYFHVDTVDNIKMNVEKSAFINSNFLLSDVDSSFKNTYSISSDLFKFNVKNINLFSDFFINDVEVDYVQHPNFEKVEKGNYYLIEETPQIFVLHNQINKNKIELKRVGNVKGDIKLKVSFDSDHWSKYDTVKTVLKDNQDKITIDLTKEDVFKDYVKSLFSYNDDEVKISIEGLYTVKFHRKDNVQGSIYIRYKGKFYEITKELNDFTFVI